MASPVPVDMVCMARQTAALVVESDHAADLLDTFPTVVGAVDILAHIFERDSVTVEYMISAVSAVGSASALAAR